MSNEPLSIATNGIIPVSKLLAENGSALDPSLSWLNQPDTGMYAAGVGFSGFGLVSGGATKLFIDDNTVDVYVPLTVKDSTAVAVPPAVVTEGNLYKKVGDNALYWNTIGGGEIDLTGGGGGGVSYPLTATNGTAVLPSYSFAADLDTGLYMPAVGSLGITIAGTQRATVTTGALSLANGVDLVLNGAATSVGLDASAVIANYTLLLPPNAGTASQVLTGNGGGVLTWTGPYLPLAGATMTGSVNMGGFNITNGGTYTAGNTSMAGNAVSATGALTLSSSTNQVLLTANPTVLLGAATKQYVDNIATGLSIKTCVRVKTVGLLPAHTSTGSGVGKTITMTAVGILVIDAIATVLGDRILVDDTGSVTGSDRGIYEVTTEGTVGVAAILTRATDADQNAEVTPGMFMFVCEGATRADTGWVLITNAPIILDGTSLSFTLFGPAASDHATLANLAVGDPHTQYVKIAGDTMTGPLLQANGAVGVPSYAFSADVDTGLFMPVVGSLGVTTAGAETWRFDSAGGLTNSGAAANVRSVIDMVSTTKGFLPPRMTTVQRDLIATIAGDEGMTIYNTIADVTQVWNGTSWATPATNTNKILNVMPTGNNANALIAGNYDLTVPFLTLLAASAAAASGDLIVVHPGAYSEAGNVHASGVNWYFHKGAVVTITAWPLFDVTTTTGGNVFGHGDFITTAVGYLYRKGVNSELTLQCNSITGAGVTITFASTTTMKVFITDFIKAGNAYAFRSNNILCNWHIECPYITSTWTLQAIFARGANTFVKFDVLSSSLPGNSFENATGVNTNILIGRYATSVNVSGKSSINVAQVERITSRDGTTEFQGHCDLLMPISGTFTGGVVDEIDASTTTSVIVCTTVGNSADAWTLNPSNTSNFELYAGILDTGSKIFNISTAFATVSLLGTWESRETRTFNISAGTLVVNGDFVSEPTGTTSPFVLTGTGKLVVRREIKMMESVPAVNMVAGTDLVFDGGTITTVNAVTPPVYMNTGAQAVEIRGGGFTTNYTGNLSGTTVQSHDYLIGDAASANITVGGTLYTSNAGSAVANAAAFDSGGAVPIPNCTDQGGGVFRIVGADSDTNFVVTFPSANLTETINATFGTFAMNNTNGGPIVQPGVFRLGTDGYGFPLASGTVGQVLQVDAAGDLVYGAAGGSGGVNQEKVLYVGTVSSGTGTRNSLSDVYLTLETAAAAALSGDIVIVLPGAYTPASTLSVIDGVNWHFHPGATVTVSFAGELFDTGLIPNTSGGNVYGKADFIGPGTGEYIFCKGADLNQTFECNSLTGAGLEITVASSTTSMKVRGYEHLTSVLTGRRVCTSAVACNWDIECPYITSNSLTGTIYVRGGSNCNIRFERFDCTGAGNAFDNASTTCIAVLTGGTSNKMQVGGKTSLNVGNITTLYGQGLIWFTGYCVTLFHAGGTINGGTYENISMTNAGDLFGELSTTVGTVNISPAGTNWCHCELTAHNGLSGTRSGAAVFTVDKAKSTLKIVGKWRANGYVFNVSDGELEVVGDYEYAGGITPFVLTGAGRMVVSGTIKTTTTGIPISTDGTATFVSKGGTITMEDSYGYPPIELSTNANMEIHSGGLSTNYQGHNLRTFRHSTVLLNVQSIPTTLTLDDGTNGPQAVSDGAAGTIALARDNLVADINSGANSALINMTAYAHATNAAYFTVICDDAVGTITTGGPVVGIFVNIYQAGVSPFKLTDLIGGPILTSNNIFNIDSILSIGDVDTTGYTFPNTAGTIGQILQVDAAGDLVYGAAGVGVSTEKVSYVGMVSAGIGAPYSVTDVYLTLESASAAASAGDLIIVLPGTYTPILQLFVVGVNWYFHPGATVTPTAAVAVLFDAALSTANGGNVYGHGDFDTETSTEYVYEKATNVDQTFECNSVTGRGVTVTIAGDTVMRVRAHAFMSSALQMCCYSPSPIACRWDIEAPLITSGTSLGGTIYIRGSTSILLKCNRIVNTFGTSSSLDNATNASATANVTAEFASNLHFAGDAVVNVAHAAIIFTDSATVDFNGHCDRLRHQIGVFRGGECDDIDILAGASYGSIKTTLVGSTTPINIDPTGPLKVELTADHFGSTINTVTKVINITTAGADVKLIGNWYVRNHQFNVSAGRLRMDADYDAESAASTPFVVTGTGKLILSGTIEMDSAIPAVSLVTGGKLISKGGVIITADDTRSPIEASASSVDIKVYAGGLTTNYTGHDITIKRGITKSYIVTATTVTMDIDDGGGNESVSSGGAQASIKLARDAIIADINLGTHGATFANINMVASADSTNDAKLWIEADDPTDGVTASSLVGIGTEVTEFASYVYPLPNITGGSILQDTDVE
jgi:hypothetical protein